MQSMRKTELITNKESVGFQGVMHAINLTDVIQMECLGMSSRGVRVESAGNVGRLYFHGGQLVHAEVNGAVGEEAFFEILSWPRGAFRIEDSARAKQQTINRNWESLLMEAAHRHDEQSRTGSTVTAFPLKTNAAPLSADPMSDLFKDPDIEEGVRFSNDGTLLQAKAGDPDLLQGTFAYVVQLLQHLGVSLGTEQLREVQFIGTEQRAICVVSDETTSAVVTTSKVNLAAVAAKLS
jgi:hypothetical protein